MPPAPGSTKHGKGMLHGPRLVGEMAIPLGAPLPAPRAHKTDYPGWLGIGRVHGMVVGDAACGNVMAPRGREGMAQGG